MASIVSIKYNPYKLSTEVLINGNSFASDSALSSKVNGKRIQEWIGGLPLMLSKELGESSYEVHFYGTEMDFDDVREAFNIARRKSEVGDITFNFTKGKSTDDIQDKVVEIFNAIQADDSPIPEFKSEKLRIEFESIKNSYFPISVIATMSAGKSTLINSLLARKLMPAKAQACTAKVTEIYDNDSDIFTAKAFSDDGTPLAYSDNADYDFMENLNKRNDVNRIEVKGDIPFISAKDTALELLDTPGPNNSSNEMHKHITYNSLSNSANNLVIYILNATQLETNDDNAVLSYVSDVIRCGGKQAHDRFLFVVNKMDELKTNEGDNIEEIMKRVREYLEKHGIEDPQLFPCSAYMAYALRTHLNNIDISSNASIYSLIDEIEKKVSANDMLSVIDTLSKSRKFIDTEEYHLEKYAVLSPSDKTKLEYRLEQAKKRGDAKEQALIHFGIIPLELAIVAYVKKYAKTKKIKDLVESFQAELQAHEVLSKAKKSVATNAAAAKACEERSRIIKEKLQNGNESKEFEKRIEALDPVPEITEKADEIKKNALQQAEECFLEYNSSSVITDKGEAKQLVKRFNDRYAYAIAELFSKINDLINKDIVENSKKMLDEYCDKLDKMDQNIGGVALDFSTAELVKNKLSEIKVSAERVALTGEGVEKDVEAVGETTIEEVERVEHTGMMQKVIDGYEQRKTGTKRVKSGSHIETHKEEVENPRKWKSFWRFLQFWEPKTIEVDVSTTVDEYADVDVFENFEKSHQEEIINIVKEKVEKFSVKVAKISSGLLSKASAELDEAVEFAVANAKAQVSETKDAFKKKFKEVDKYITDLYDDLNELTKDSEETTKMLEHNQKVLNWLEATLNELDTVLDI